MEMKIFDIKINFYKYDKIVQLIFGSNIRTITCVNHYYLNLIYKNFDYKNEVNNIDFIHPDGIGVQLAYCILTNFQKFTSRVNGSDLYFHLLDELNNQKKSIFLFGDSDEVLNKVLVFIKKKYPEIILLGKQNGFSKINNDNFIKKINDLCPYMLFVGIGAPRQENWINTYKDKLKASKIIAIGGGFRVIGGDRKRGPMWMRRIGLEWLIRLLTEPRKLWKRYILGIPLFIYRIIKYKFRTNQI